MASADTERPLRLCDVCGQLDDHPRHVQSARGTAALPSREFLESLGTDVPATAIAQLMNPNTTVRHLDCCAAEGCPVCTRTEGITKGARGSKLLKAIQSGALDDLTFEED
jgi:hypothetical protein